MLTHKIMRLARRYTPIWFPALWIVMFFVFGADWVVERMVGTFKIEDAIMSSSILIVTLLIVGFTVNLSIKHNRKEQG